jgi:lathosterol oxidase
MDLVLDLSEKYLMKEFYAALPPTLFRYVAKPDFLLRQGLSLWALTTLGGLVLYFGLSYIAYELWFDKKLLKHPKFVKNQISKEIQMSMLQIPLGSLFMIPFWLFEVNGYSKVYHDIDEYGWSYLLFSIAAFLVVSDFGIYWIHRWEHHPYE